MTTKDKPEIEPPDYVLKSGYKFTRFVALDKWQGTNPGDAEWADILPPDPEAGAETKAPKAKKKIPPLDSKS